MRKKSSKRPSVRLSVRPSHCAALLKRCMLRSQNLYCVMPHELYYSGKISRRWVMGGSICRTKAWKRDTPKMFSSEKWSLYRYWLVAWKREKRPDANSLKNFERNKDPHNVIIKKKRRRFFLHRRQLEAQDFFAPSCRWRERRHASGDGAAHDHHSPQTIPEWRQQQTTTASRGRPTASVLSWFHRRHESTATPPSDEVDGTERQTEELSAPTDHWTRTDCFTLSRTFSVIFYRHRHVFDQCCSSFPPSAASYVCQHWYAI